MATLRTPRLPSRAASSSAARASSEPRRRRPLAAAWRSREVRTGAHHVPRCSAVRSAAVESGCARRLASASMMASCSAATVAVGSLLVSTWQSGGMVFGSRSDTSSRTTMSRVATLEAQARSSVP